MSINSIVVGSGPSGISVAKALLERGCKVILLDVGKTLELGKQELLHKIKQNQIIDKKSLQFASNAKTQPKLPYGSTFIYDDVKNEFLWKSLHCYFQPSFARGGLSNVWGSVVTQFASQDLLDWPLPCRDLSLYYSTIISWLGQYYLADTSSQISRQASFLKESWENNQYKLNNSGFLFNTASLAIDFERCVFCGSCQYGCPYELIYNSSIHLNSLMQNPNFTYVSNAIVENFFENRNEAVVVVKYNNQIQHFYADRLYIGCGAGLSSLLYLRSLNIEGKKIYLKDSQHFILPGLLKKPIKNAVNENLHTLCQLKATIHHKNVSQFPIYLQFYTYMDLYFHEIKKKLKWTYPLLRPFMMSFINRFIVIQGYLDAKESNRLSIEYNQGNFLIQGENVNCTSSVINKVVRYLKQNCDYLAFNPLHLLLSQSLTGQSNHISGSLPMSNNPQDDEVDIWGRPPHFDRVHFIDGSILPSIPAGPITLTIMANAYRIGKEGPL